MNNADYWANRMRIVNDAIFKKTDEYIANLEKQFNAAIRELDTKIRAWYQRFADNNGGMSYAQANKLLTAGELKEFKWDVWEYIEKCKESAVNGAWIKELENASARVHISRLESIKLQLRQQAEMLTQARLDATTDASSLAYTESYYHTAFEIQRGIGVGWTMQGVNSSFLEKVLARPWTTDNRTFTARCWDDKVKLVNLVNQEITRMAATGAAPDRAIANIAKQFNTTKSNAGRVVMTESAHFQLEAQKNCFDELGVELYQIVAGLDTETCDLCGSMDRKVFKMSEYEEGVTAPLFHPRCRCCTAPYHEDMKDLGERFARDAKTGKGYRVPKNTTYAEWKAQQDAAYGEGFVNRQRSKRYNYAADKAQYQAYKTRLGAEAPKSFTAFQTLKYDTPDAWDDLSGYYRYKGNNPSSNRGLYNANNAVKALRSTGTIRAKGTVTSAPKGRRIVDYNTHAFEDMEKRGITLETAQKFIDKAVFALKQRKGTQYAFYSSEGYAVLDNDGLLTSVGYLDEGGKILYEEVMKYAGSSK